jgi:hypothetical protein
VPSTHRPACRELAWPVRWARDLAALGVLASALPLVLVWAGLLGVIELVAGGRRTNGF